MMDYYGLAVFDICMWTLSTAINLKMGKEELSGKTANVCDVCKKLFSKASTLKTHMMTHSGATWMWILQEIVLTGWCSEDAYDDTQ